MYNLYYKKYILVIYTYNIIYDVIHKYIIYTFFFSFVKTYSPVSDDQRPVAFDELSPWREQQSGRLWSTSVEHSSATPQAQESEPVANPTRQTHRGYSIESQSTSCDS